MVAADGYRELLRRVEGEVRSYDGSWREPCAEQRLARLDERARKELGVELPGDYADFLRVTDGLNHNGLFVYASERSLTDYIDGFVEANLDLRDDDRFFDLLVFGDDGLDLYARRVSTGGYEILDVVPLNLIETPPSFAALMSAAFRRCLSG